MGRVLILGAGASKFAGFPLALELWPFVRDLSGGHVQAETRRREVTVALERILQQVGPPPEQDRPNLEGLFTLLDLADMGTAPLQLLHTDWKDMRPKLMGMIADAFQWHQYNLRKDQTRFSKIEQVLKNWASVLVAGDTLITFNWDLLHEYGLWAAKKWHYADGYGFPCEDAPKGVHSPVKILKLHGSVNWAQRDEVDVCPSRWSNCRLPTNDLWQYRDALAQPKSRCKKKRTAKKAAKGNAGRSTFSRSVAETRHADACNRC